MTYRMEADGSARLSERHLAKPGSFPKSLAAKPPFWNRPVLRVRRPVVGGSGNGGCWIEPAILGHERERRVCPNPKRCAPGESDQNTPFPIRAGYVGSRRKAVGWAARQWRGSTRLFTAIHGSRSAAGRCVGSHLPRNQQTFGGYRDYLFPWVSIFGSVSVRSV